MLYMIIYYTRFCLMGRFLEDHERGQEDILFLFNSSYRRPRCSTKRVSSAHSKPVHFLVYKYKFKIYLQK